MHKKILIPLPSYGFDPSEVAIPWKILTQNGMEPVFATPDGTAAQADSLMLTGQGLGIWKPILRARKDAVEAYREMGQTPAFARPIRYTDIGIDEFDALLLPGGHDKGVKEYLESAILQDVVQLFFKRQKPVAAICHGVVLAARSLDPETQKSVLYGYNTTALLQSQEMLAYRLTRRRLGDYYLTYPGLTVQNEVTTALARPEQFLEGPYPVLRDSPNRLNRGFTVRDRHYLSARWPGDAYRFSLQLVGMLNES